MKVRVKFSKYGALRFIGHLDVMRYFQKALRRADADVLYSKGFSPHMLLSFASPLGLGLTSDGEYMDVELGSTLSSAEMLKRIQAQMAEGIDVTDFRLLPEKSKPAMAEVAAADYRVSIREGHKKPEKIWGKDALPAVLESFLQQKEVLVTRQTKKSEVEMDLLPYIYELRVDETREDAVFMKVSAGSVCNIRPEVVVDAIYKFMGCTSEEFDYEIHRYEMYAAKTAEDGSVISLIPLCDQGEPVMSPISEDGDSAK